MTELFMIDANVADLTKLYFRPGVISINLHCNHITRIAGISHLKQLRHLNLSSNQIERISGLNGLRQLKTLNLSCNLIELIEGLKDLTSLQSLDISYNKINNLSGIQDLNGPNYSLCKLELQGNSIGNLALACKSLAGCTRLRQLTLSQASADNPICHATGYHSVLFSAVVSLQVLDGVDRQGRIVPSDDDFVTDDTDFLGEDSFSGFVSNDDAGASKVPVSTPHIDAALNTFRQRSAVPASETSTLSASEPETSVRLQTAQRSTTASSKAAKQSSAEYDSRLDKLELQFRRLLQATQTLATDKQKIQEQKTNFEPRRDTDPVDDSDSDFGDVSVSDAASHDPVASRSRVVKKSSSSSSVANSGVTAGKSSGSSEKERHEADGSRVASSKGRVRKATAVTKLKTGSGSAQQKGSAPDVTSARDQQYRDDLKATYTQLVKELNSEREQRLKAEGAARRLAQQLQVVEVKAKEDELHGATTAELTKRLKQALATEREGKQQALDDCEGIRLRLEEAAQREATARQELANCQQAMKDFQEAAANEARENLQRLAHDAKRLQEAQMRAAAAEREADIIKGSLETARGQVQQLQQLLAAREQDHRKELEGRYGLDSRELQAVIAQHTARLEKAYELQMKALQDKIDGAKKQYSDLENEFRMALQIESSRFKELQVAYERASQEAAEVKQTVQSATAKDDQSRAMVNELTALVKEQKGRIMELSKAKQEQTHQLRERVETLETHLDEARRRMVQFELLKQEKVKLLAQVQAQESVIEGLKAERKLWSEELAQQGSSLAQDRGRLEAQAESAKNEVNTLKKQLEREADTVRIKTKVIDDQTDSIRKLREGLLERDEEIKKARQEALTVQRELEDQLTAEHQANVDLQEKLERTREKRDELREQLAIVQNDLEESKRAHSTLNAKWKERSSLIGQLEEQVQQMRDTWASREKKINEERDKALDAARMAVEKAKQMDDSFRKQLDLKEASHRTALEELRREKNRDVEQANRKVQAVEDEMRVLLKEVDNSKKATEDRIKQLTKAFLELQENI